MKKTLAILMACALALLSGACCSPSPAQKKTVDDLDRVLNEKFLPRYQAYVDKDADPGHDAAWKDDQKKLIEAVKAAVGAVKEAMNR
jgi:hypothetical protein